MLIQGRAQRLWGPGLSGHSNFRSSAAVSAVMMGTRTEATRSTFTHGVKTKVKKGTPIIKLSHLVKDVTILL